MADEGLSPDEVAFFQSGDANHLKTETVTPAPTPEPTPTPTPTPEPVADPMAELRAQLETERLARAAAESRAQTLEQLQQAPPPVKAEPPDPGPNPATDPLGAMMHQQKLMQKHLETLNEQITNQQTQNAQQRQFTDFVANVRTVRDQYEQAHPDFAAAYQHLRTVRAADLRDAGIPESQINQALLNDELRISANAIRDGRNPAEVMHNMAKRAGFAGAAPPPSTTDPAKTILNATKGQSAALDVQRGAPSSEITLETLKNAGDADLTKVALDDRLWAKVVGNTTPLNDIF